MATTTTYVVTATFVAVKSKASSTGSTLGTLLKGSKIEVISITSSWAYFMYNSKNAYVPVSSISKVATTGSITIKYSDIDTNTDLLAADLYSNLALGSYSYSAKSISKYSLVGNTTQSVTLTQSSPNTTVTFSYKKILGSVTIKYIDANTQADIAPSSVISNLDLNSYTYNAIAFSNDRWNSINYIK